ncbi:hypothetical protein V8C86DRAFT_2704997, partial [Haematococcus lacustris]
MLQLVDTAIAAAAPLLALPEWTHSLRAQAALMRPHGEHLLQRLRMMLRRLATGEAGSCGACGTPGRLLVIAAEAAGSQLALALKTASDSVSVFPAPTDNCSRAPHSSDHQRWASPDTGALATEAVLCAGLDAAAAERGMGATPETPGGQLVLPHDAAPERASLGHDNAARPCTCAALALAWLSLEMFRVYSRTDDAWAPHGPPPGISGMHALTGSRALLTLPSHLAALARELNDYDCLHALRRALQSTTLGWPTSVVEL